jgi:hypothetical protein
VILTGVYACPENVLWMNLYAHMLYTVGSHQFMRMAESRQLYELE